MDGYQRYAIYWAPEQGSPLARFGAAWLGWDPAAGAMAGAPPPGPEVQGLPAAREALVARPRRYGFHATLKAPFRLAEGASADALAAAAASLAAGHRAFELAPLRLAQVGSFLALVPAAPQRELDALAADCVTRLDRFRAPMSPAERRHRCEGLNDRQAALLARWGYPFVLEEFGFHLTLTGPLEEPARNAAQAALAPILAPCLGRRQRVAEICLFGEMESGFFRLLCRQPLA